MTFLAFFECPCLKSGRLDTPVDKIPLPSGSNEKPISEATRANRSVRFFSILWATTIEITMIPRTATKKNTGNKGNQNMDGFSRTFWHCGGGVSKANSTGLPGAAQYGRSTKRKGTAKK